MITPMTATTILKSVSYTDTHPPQHSAKPTTPQNYNQYPAIAQPYLNMTRALPTTLLTPNPRVGKG